MRYLPTHEMWMLIGTYINPMGLRTHVQIKQIPLVQKNPTTKSSRKFQGPQDTYQTLREVSTL